MWPVPDRTNTLIPGPQFQGSRRKVIESIRPDAPPPHHHGEAPGGQVAPRSTGRDGAKYDILIQGASAAATVAGAFVNCERAQRLRAMGVVAAVGAIGVTVCLLRGERRSPGLRQHWSTRYSLNTLTEGDC